MVRDRALRGFKSGRKAWQPLQVAGERRMRGSLSKTSANTSPTCGRMMLDKYIVASCPDQMAAKLDRQKTRPWPSCCAWWKSRRRASHGRQAHSDGSGSCRLFGMSPLQSPGVLGCRYIYQGKICVARSRHRNSEIQRAFWFSGFRFGSISHRKRPWLALAEDCSLISRAGRIYRDMSKKHLTYAWTISGRKIRIYCATRPC